MTQPAYRTVVMLDRMLRMLELMAQGLKPGKLIEQIVNETGCSESAAWRTWQKRDVWMPKLVKAPEVMGELTADLLRDLREARRLAFNLYYRAEAGGARVGALKVATDAVEKEIKIRQSLGQLEKAPETIKMEVDKPVINEEDVARYISTIVKIVMEQEARELNEDPDPENTPQPLG